MVIAIIIFRVAFLFHIFYKLITIIEARSFVFMKPHIMFQLFLNREYNIAIRIYLT